MRTLTAIIVTCNEGHLLARCLDSLSFCSQIIVIDLESTDSSRATAARHGAKVISHTRVNHVEHIHAKIRSFTEDKWVLLMDPDEEVSQPLQSQIIKLMQRDDLESFGQIFAPWQFYFGKKKLTGTRWGGKNKKDFIINVDGVNLTGFVHQGRVRLPTHDVLEIAWNEQSTNVVNHYWMTDFKQLVAKHKRYLQAEGSAMQNAGETYSRSKHLRNTYIAFKECFIWQKGYRDGVTGLLLSIFWSWYTSEKWKSLRIHERLQAKSN